MCFFSFAIPLFTMDYIFFVFGVGFCLGKLFQLHLFCQWCWFLSNHLMSQKRWFQHLSLLVQAEPQFCCSVFPLLRQLGSFFVCRSSWDFFCCRRFRKELQFFVATSVLTSSTFVVRSLIPHCCSSNFRILVQSRFSPKGY